MWITLKEILNEFVGVVPKIVGGLGKLFGVDMNNEFFANQHFCIALSSEEG